MCWGYFYFSRTIREKPFLRNVFVCFTPKFTIEESNNCLQLYIFGKVDLDHKKDNNFGRYFFCVR